MQQLTASPSTLPAARNDHAAIMEQVAINGNLAGLSAAERVSYYLKLCESLGLNPLSKPFDYLTLNSKLVLYAKKDCTDQLRSNRKVNISIVGRDRVEDVYVVTARASLPDGRVDESIGAVPLGNLRGEQLANALMKAETKAKRRVTLSICGLGWTDESEVDSIPGASRTVVNFDTGEIVDQESIPFPATEPARIAPPARASDTIERLSDPADSRWQWFMRLSQAAGPLKIPVPKLAIPVPVPALEAANKGLAMAIEQRGGQLPEPIDTALPTSDAYEVEEGEWREAAEDEATEQPALV